MLHRRLLHPARCCHGSAVNHLLAGAPLKGVPCRAVYSLQDLRGLAENSAAGVLQGRR